MLSSLRVLDRHQGWLVGTFAVVATAGLLASSLFVKPRTATAEIDGRYYLLAEWPVPPPADNRVCLRRPPSIEWDRAIIHSPEFRRRLAKRCVVAPELFELSAEPTAIAGHLRLRVSSRSSASAKRLADEAAAEYVRLREESRRRAYQQTLNYLTQMEAASRRRFTELKRRPRLNEADRRAYGQAEKAVEAYAERLAALRPGMDALGPQPRIVSWSRESGAANARIFVAGWLLAALLIALGVVQLRARRV